MLMFINTKLEPYVPYEVSVRAVNSAGVEKPQGLSSSQKKEVEWFSKNLLDFEKRGFVYFQFHLLPQLYSLFKELTRPLH